MWPAFFVPFFVPAWTLDHVESSQQVDTVKEGEHQSEDRQTGSLKQKRSYYPKALLKMNFLFRRSDTLICYFSGGWPHCQLFVKISWLVNLRPPNVPPPRNKALLRVSYWSLVSLYEALLSLCFYRGYVELLGWYLGDVSFVFEEDSNLVAWCYIYIYLELVCPSFLATLSERSTWS